MLKLEGYQIAVRRTSLWTTYLFCTQHAQTETLVFGGSRKQIAKQQLIAIYVDDMRGMGSGFGELLLHHTSMRNYQETSTLMLTSKSSRTLRC